MTLRPPHDLRRFFDDDPITRMRLHEHCLLASEACWDDAVALAGNRITHRVSDQLYRAVGSIGANLAEGYSRSSIRDRSRIYEYSLGSSRESREWYVRSVPVLGEARVREGVDRLGEINRILLAILRRGRDERGVRFDI